MNRTCKLCGAEITRDDEASDRTGVEIWRDSETWMICVPRQDDVAHSPNCAGVGNGYWECDIPGGCRDCKDLALEAGDFAQLFDWNESLTAPSGPEDFAEDDPDVAFFYEHAGWGYNPAVETPEEGKLRSAKALVAAEKWAKQAGYKVVREDDWAVGNHVHEFPDAYDTEPETCETFILMTPDGDVAGTLGCVDDADEDYARVVSAELALEVMPEVEV